MIIVTGAAGFIGSNLVLALNARGHKDILAVDDLSDGRKFLNIVDAQILDYIDKDEFRRRVLSNSNEFATVSCVYHLGACSDTTEWDGRYMLDTNYAYSRDLLDYCQRHDIQFVYASSAAVYGLGNNFKETPENEHPLNVYGYSKLLLDRYVRQLEAHRSAQIVGLRYFNVYGPREAHKAKMASVAFHFNEQLSSTGTVKLFAGSHGYADGEHQRDFIHVDDAVNVTLWMGENSNCSGIFNCGTGNAETFNTVARAVLKYHGHGSIDYIPFPPGLSGAYQSFTQADVTQLREAGYHNEFSTVGDGVERYLDWLA